MASDRPQVRDVVGLFRSRTSDLLVSKPELDFASLIAEGKSPETKAGEAENLLSEVKKSSLAILGEQGSTQLQLDLLTFSERMQRLGKEAEVVQTYSSFLKLLDGSVALMITDHERALLVQHLGGKLAHPELIDQGLHGTCGYAALEYRLAKLYPSSLTSFIFEVAENGNFKLSSGPTVSVPRNSLSPDDEAKINPPVDNKRDYGSQIFQVAAANVFWQTLTHDRYGRALPMGSFVYEQKKSVSREPLDSGEQLSQVIRPYLRPGDPAEPLVMPGFGGESSLAGLYEVYTKLSFPKSDNFLLSRSERPAKGVSTVKSPEELKAYLETQSANSYPILVAVNLNYQPFRSDFESSYGMKPDQSSRHIVTIDSFDITQSSVVIHNTINASHGNHRMTVRNLFEAMI